MNMDGEEQTQSLLGPSREELAGVKVFPLVTQLKKDVIDNVDTALSWDQLTAADISFALVRPLVFKYARLRNPATPYAALVVRSHFLTLASEDMAFAGVSVSRANLCEILAMKLLAPFAASKVELVAVLMTSWSPLAGASREVVEEVRVMMGGEDDDVVQDPQCVLEMAIATKAKSFLSAPLVQTVITDIYRGRVVFSMASHKSLLADNYKPRAIEMYDPRKGPFLDHYRLRVPRYGAILEFINFALLLLTFVLCLSNADRTQVQTSEIVFIVFAVSFILEEYGVQKEHGWAVYIANMWNVFDTSFIIVVLGYLGCRAHGLMTHNLWWSEYAFDILACGACILFPRLAFFAVSNNLVVLALRGMIAEFAFFMGIAAICFSGLLFTLWTLASDTWPVKSIAWLMVQIWFGNTYLSFSQAESFHPVFGPILMTGFAALSNSLLLTILIAILSNTYARIASNANQEYLFQYAISTIEGVKSDALFSYQPPFNLLAFAILWPSSWVLSPRALHTLNVFLIKLTSFPTLIMIGLYERYFIEGGRLHGAGKDAAQSLFNTLPRQIKRMALFDALIGHDSSDLFEAIFDVDAESDTDLFGADDGAHDRDALRSIASAEDLRMRRVATTTPTLGGGSMRPPGSPDRRGISLSPNASPRKRRGFPSAIDTSYAAEVPSLGKRSPLARLFAPEPAVVPPSPGEMLGANLGAPQAHAAMKKMESLLEEFKALPATRLREEMKELQDRQARIENLLLMLTRGMRHDTTH